MPELKNQNMHKRRIKIVSKFVETAEIQDDIFLSGPSFLIVGVTSAKIFSWIPGKLYCKGEPYWFSG